MHAISFFRLVQIRYHYYRFVGHLENGPKLLEARDGDKRSLDSLIAAVYTELKRIAASLMRGQVNGRTLQPTALVNEAWLRLAAGDRQWDNKAHFFGAAARAMRQVLIEEARRRSSQKRAGGAKRVTLRDLDIKAEEPDVDLLALDEARPLLERSLNILRRAQGPDHPQVSFTEHSLGILLVAQGKLKEALPYSARMHFAFE